MERLADLLLPEWVGGADGGDDIDIVAEDFGNAPVPVAVATTEVSIPLADIIAGKHAINVERPTPTIPRTRSRARTSAASSTRTAICSSVSRETNDSGHSGVAWLHDNGTGTTIVVFLAHPEETAGIETAWQRSPRGRRRGRRDPGG